MRSFKRTTWTTYVIGSLCGLTVILSLSVLARYSVANFGQPWYDDAYMFIRYAKHWLAGHGFSWNIGDGPAYGCTSALHLWIVTLYRGVFSLSDGVVLAAASWTAGFAFMVALVATSYVTMTNARLGNLWIHLLVLPVILLQQHSRVHFFTGMETTLSALCNMLLVLCVVLYARRPSALGMVVCLFSAYCSFQARPDNGLVCLLVPPLYLFAERRRLHRQAILYVGLLVVLLALDAMAKKVLFGGVLPLGFYVKRSGFYAGYLGADTWNVGRYLVQFGQMALPFLVLLILFVQKASLAKVLALLVPVALTFAYYGSVVQIMGFHARFYYPALPFFAAAAFIALNAGIDSILPKGRGLPRGTAWRLAAALVVGLALSLPVAEDAAGNLWQRNVVSPPEQVTVKTQYSTVAAPPLPRLKGWEVIQHVQMMALNVPLGASVAMTEYGLVGATVPELRIIDLAGLHDRQVAYNGLTAEYLWSLEPDLIWLPHIDYGQLRREILDSPTFHREYLYYASVFEFGIALRKRSPYLSALDAAVRARFAEAYPTFNLDSYLARPVLESDGR